MTKGRNTNL